MNAEKSTFRQTLGKLIQFCRPWYGWIIITFIFAVGAVILQLIGPRLVGDMVDHIIYMISFGQMGNAGGYPAIVHIGTILVIIYLAMFVLGYIQQLIMAWVTAKLQERLRREMSEKINKLPLSHLDRTPTGDTLSRITNDVDMVTMTLNYTAVTFISATTMLVGAAIFMFITNWIMALVAIGTSLFAFFLMAVIMKRSQIHFERQQKELGDVNAHIEEYFSGHTAVKTNNARQRTSARFDKFNNALFTSAWKSQFYGGLMVPLMSFLGQFALVAVMIAGGILAFNGTITFGVVVAFMIYVNLFTQPLSDLAQSAMDTQSTVAATDRIFELLQSEEMEEEDHLTEHLICPARGAVNFQNVRFGYFDDKTVINDFTADIKSGSRVAIVGPTGAGKTTLVNLLMKFYKLNDGDIKIDGVSINEMRRGNVTSLFSMVLQDAWLFRGTIRENLLYNMKVEKGKEQELLDQAARAAGIDHFIKALPEGYDTVLDEKANVSDGQKQLLTIARAMIKDAPLLILDEATSSVDTRTEAIVKDAMEKLTHGRTSFVIAHRLSTIKNADLIIVMDKGDIVESGTHTSLLKKNGFYAELYNSQFAD
ncbi:MAG: ABC transporter ATP-binding protein/permease [Methanomassiliicoccaceae archaeon]|nr:ABC transporter ATP-binding protein/permease [Methanomassiliicoccaceae archaeon]